MSVSYDGLLESYARWLEALNYERTNARYAPGRVREFFSWLKQHGIPGMDQVSTGTIAAFFEDLSLKVNPRTGLGLSVHSLKAYQKELRRFSRYLLESSQGQLPVEITIKAPAVIRSSDVIFSRAEIRRLYEACQDDPLGIRDRAMLSVYYGCGLRRNEGAALRLKDVALNQGMLYVRKGKNYKERYVPMSSRVIRELTEYLVLGRSRLENGLSKDHFFISYAGRGVDGQSLGKRFTQLKRAAGINKPGSLHGLRHSIATHLLESGMPLEQIARFLGHRSLESTQIYTHIVRG